MSIVLLDLTALADPILKGLCHEYNSQLIASIGFTVIIRVCEALTTAAYSGLHWIQNLC